MTKKSRRPRRHVEGEGLVSQRIDRQLLSRTCAWCGTDIAYTGRGRPPRFCSRGCRQRDYELRTAATRYEAAAAADAARGPGTPVRETVRELEVRTTTRTVAGPPVPYQVHVERIADPGKAREVRTYLEKVADAIREGRIGAFDHRHVMAGVSAVLHALDAAHPGGLDALGKRRR